MLDHLIVTIYGYRVSIHRLIQLMDQCFLGGLRCLGWSADGGIHSIGVTIPHHRDCHPGMWAAGYTDYVPMEN